jgi:uncharacterized RDD family membrane protein YckC
VDIDTAYSRVDLFDLMSRHSWQAWAIGLGALAVWVLYYAVLEGRWGVTPGKLACGLRVVGPNNRPPGFWRALPRPLIFLVVPGLPSWLVYWMDPEGYFSAPSLYQTYVGLSVYVLMALCFCTARRRNGFAAVHDLVTRTRVISRTMLHTRPASVVAEAAPAAVETTPLIGPYHILQTLEDSNGTAWRVGYDLRLLRKVWIRTVAPGTPPVPAPLRNLRRVGRLRWLSGWRSPELSWDAFEAPRGQPLLKLLREAPAASQSPAASPQPWSQVRYWLSDLACELDAAQADGTVPPRLALDRVWITDDGRAKLLDFPAPGLAATEGPSAKSDGATAPPCAGQPPANQSAATRFLCQAAAAALAGRADAAAAPPAAVPIPLPWHARLFLKGLPQLIDANAIRPALRPLLERVATITRLRRAIVVAACATLPLLFACFLLIGMGMITDWNGRHGRPYELFQLLALRSAVRHTPHAPAGPTDRQFAIYVASHYRAAITNDATWSSVLSHNLVKGEDRRFAEQSLNLSPPPTDDEAAKADAAIKKLPLGASFLDTSEAPSLVLMLVNLTLAIYVALPAVVTALAFRGGLVLLAAGVTFVRRDGVPASRLRLLWRALLTWIPLLPAAVLSVECLGSKNPVSATLASGLFLCLAVVSAALPQRGLQDRLAGTWPVPR